MSYSNAAPLVIVANDSEAFNSFLNRDPNPISRAYRLRSEQFRGDRALIWGGDPKLVITSFPVPSLDYVRRTLGFSGTELAYPVNQSTSLCMDIIRESALMDRLIGYAGSAKTLKLIPYATTAEFLELVDVLRVRANLNVLLPETPPPHSRWILNHLDTKSGFRASASAWLSGLPIRIPEGYICQNPEEAEEIVLWFASRNSTCMMKADKGENGYGNIIISPDIVKSGNQISEMIHSNPFFGADLIVVEEFIAARRMISPSFEGFVPPPEIGQPQMTYVSTQLFRQYGDFCGVVTSKEQQLEPWYESLVQAGLVVARKLQEMGYVGHFDMDAVVDDAGQLFPVEINPRRTGGTHVHDFAKYCFGDNYLDSVALLSRDPVSTKSIQTISELLDVLSDLTYPIKGQRRGVIPTVTSPIHEKEFGCVIVGCSEVDVLEMQDRMLERVEGK